MKFTWKNHKKKSNRSLSMFISSKTCLEIMNFDIKRLLFKDKWPKSNSFQRTTTKRKTMCWTLQKLLGGRLIAWEKSSGSRIHLKTPRTILNNWNKHSRRCRMNSIWGSYRRKKDMINRLEKTWGSRWKGAVINLETNEFYDDVLNSLENMNGSLSVILEFLDYEVKGMAFHPHLEEPQMQREFGVRKHEYL